ncbi:MAG: hypothetical protein KIT09_30445 [Bryobacteraceae bacterium]|nr:hypothetical protein [Bryobacteraceae bacterium]
MKHAIKTPKTYRNATPGFAIEITDDTELGSGILIAVGDGRYQPLGVVISINEAREVADDDLRRRMRELEAGGEPMCPESYVVWAMGLEGEYRELKRFRL